MQLFRRPDGAVVPLFTRDDFNRICPQCGSAATRWHTHHTKKDEYVSSNRTDGKVFKKVQK